ncbi:MAG: BamA/TamA family outer membrane protein, partial [Bdellovibrionales bacterium]
VLNLLKFKKGSTLTPKKIENSQKALRSTELFSQVNLDYHYLSKTDISIVVSLQERKTRSIRGGIGMNSERGITARSYVEFRHRNLLGLGRSLFVKTRGQTSFTNISPFLEYELSTRYKEIFIPGKNYEGNINFSTAKDIFNYSRKKINSIYKNQISFFINKTVTDDLHLKWSLFNFEHRKEGCVHIQCSKNLQRIGSSSFTFKWDNRDNIFNPKKGYMISLSGELASPYLGSSSDIQFWKFHFQKNTYYTFEGNYTLALALKAGQIQASQAIPISRAFLLGGQSSIRGYDGNIEGERIPSIESAPIETANEYLKLRRNRLAERALTNSYGLTKLELRFPVSKSFKGLIFYDAGFIFMKGKRQDLTEYGQSIGMGFRYEIFVLPIGLDIGYKLPPKRGADYRFHFSIGLF